MGTLGQFTAFVFCSHLTLCCLIICYILFEGGKGGSLAKADMEMELKTEMEVESNTNVERELKVEAKLQWRRR